MPKIQDILMRLNETDIYEVLGSSTHELIKALAVAPPQLKDLIDFVVNDTSAEEWLSTQSKRNRLIDLLRPNEVQNLANLLNLEKRQEIARLYELIKTKTFRKNSSDEKILFGFFGIDRDSEDINVTESKEQIKSEYSLFPHQLKTLSAVIEKFKTNKRILLQMPTGAGKTRTAMNIIVEHLRSREKSVVIWLAFNEELCEQACNEFKKAWKFLGNREIGIRRFWGIFENDETFEDGLLVASLQKMNAKLNNDQLFANRLARKSNFVVMDEAHQAIAPTYSFVLDQLVVPFDETKCLGLTATPGRSWDEIEQDEKLAEFFDKTKIAMQTPNHQNPINYLTENRFLAKIRKSALVYHAQNITDTDLRNMNNSIDFSTSILKRLGSEVGRNFLVYNAVRRALEDHHRVLVFACSLESSDTVAAALKMSGVNAYSLTSDSSDLLRREKINEFRERNTEKMVLLNYGILTTGFDAPNTSCVIVARPTKSLVLYTQMIGRAIRGARQGGNENAEVITIVDDNLPGFRDLAEAFNHWDDAWGE